MGSSAHSYSMNQEKDQKPTIEDLKSGGEDWTAEEWVRNVAEIEYDGRTPFSVGGLTFWKAVGPCEDPYFQAFASVDGPAWYPLVTYTVRESYDGDGWVVSSTHHNHPQPLPLTDHPVFEDQSLPGLLAAIAVLIRARINPFWLIDRRWHSARTIDVDVLQEERDALAEEAARALDCLPEGDV